MAANMELDVLTRSAEGITADVLTKYKMAADIVNKCVAQLTALSRGGVRVVDLCEHGDNFVHKQLASVFTKGQVEKGPAFPTCVCVNECAQNFSPLASDSKQIATGDVVKIVVGVQIDGYAVTGGHTLIVPGAAATVAGSPTTGRAADAICAAYLAAEVVHRMLRPGVKSSELTAAVTNIAKAYRCLPVHDLASFNTKRFILEGEKCFLNRESNDQNPAEFEVEEGDVFAVDVMISTGTGSTRREDERTTVYQRDVSVMYMLKLKASRQVYADITARFPTMPFTTRALDPKVGLLGVKECITHKLLVPFPVTYERAGEVVAQFKFTAVVQEHQTVRLTGHPCPYVKSEFSITQAQYENLLSQAAPKDGPKKATFVDSNPLLDAAVGMDED